MSSTRTGRAIVLAAVLLTALVYLPGMSGGFVFDDYANILNNEKMHLDRLTVNGLLEAGWSGMSGPLKRPIAMASFALNYATTGAFVAAFKYTNLVIHLLNGILLAIFARMLLTAHVRRTGPRDIDVAVVAALAAALWMLHPLNLTSILYVVQRMTSLAALFSLLAMIAYCAGRRRQIDGERGGWWLILLWTPLATALGILSKENAALTVPLLGVIELCIFRFDSRDRRDRRFLAGLFIVVLVIPALLGAVYVALDPDFLARRFDSRPFTLTERLLTESRVLWFYLSLLLVPQLSRFGLHHDDYVLSTGLFEPPVTGLAVAGIVFAVIAGLAALRRAPMLAFAIGWYLVAHSMESSVVALELVHEHRNYLPSMGVVIALTWGGAVLLREHVAGVFARRAVALLLVALCAALTLLRAGDWSDPVTLAKVEAARHPDSFRSVYELGRIEFGLYKMNHREQHFENALANLEHAAALDENATPPLAALMKLAYARGFEPKPEWKTQLLERYRHGVFHMSETRDLHQMVKCRAERECRFPAEDIFEFYFAALANPTLQSYSKAQLMIDLAIFYVNEAGDLEPAMRLLDDAVALHPDEFGFRKTRMQVYLMAKRYDEVAAELEQVRSVTVWRDELTSPVGEIAEIEQDLARLRKQ